MRNILLPLVAATSAVVIAAPASAQNYGNLAPYNPTYNYSPYNYGYGYSGHAFVQQMQARVQRIRSDIRNMQMRRMLSAREARNLDNQAIAIQRRIARAPSGGIRPQEARGIENRIRNLEIRVQRQAWDWNSRYGRHRR